ncbi:MAG TPA: dTDP-4-dehydrorhamnose reductase [Planctomycetaceae bacterium]|nr:dTDP-4-dehydrorhamnose reductase [Planctomycetaceae bacterium]
MGHWAAGGRVVVVGSEGQLGGELCRQLGRRAVGLDLPAFDLTRPELVIDRIASIEPAVVVNAAAYTRVDQAEEEPDRCWAINATAVGHLVEACRRCGAVLVQVSTDYVFGGDATRRRPYGETDPPSPLGVYGRSKLAGEIEARRWPRHLIVRTCGLYGPPSSRSARNFVEAVLRLGQAGGVIRVVQDQVCSPTYTVHLARAMLFLAGTEAFGTYHVVNTGQTTWYGFAAAIFRLAGWPVDLEPITGAQYGLKAPRPGYSVLDTAKYHALPGCSAMPPWQDALEEYLRRRLPRIVGP